MMAIESDPLLLGDSSEVLSYGKKKLASFFWVLLSLVSGIVLVVYSLQARLAGENHLSLSTTAAHVLNGVVGLEGSVTSATSPRYKATQFISFTINTLGGLADRGECTGREVDMNGVCYLGNYNITEDMEHRLLIVRAVLEKLKDDINQKHSHIDHRNDVLKIFAMPEFYFRGPYGAYTAEQVFGDGINKGILMKLFDKVREYIKDEVFSNYLFLFGTVIAVAQRNPDNTITGRIQTLDPEKLVYSNFCPVGKGGPNNIHYFMVLKKYISLVDFLDRTTLPNPRNFNGTYYKHDDFSDRFRDLMTRRQVQIITDNVIDLDGLKIGLEVCLDHRMGALWDNLQNKYNSNLVDVQIITSAGMAIERGVCPIVPGGVVYLSDGGASSAACYRSSSDKNGQHFDPNSTCRKPGPKGLKHLPTTTGAGSKKYSEFFPVSTCLPLMDQSADLLTGYYSHYQTQGCAYTLKEYGLYTLDEFDHYPPSIEIYPTVDLPESAYHKHW